MKPLLQIQTIPISIQYKTNPAQVERKNVKAEVEVSRDKKGLSIKSRPIKLTLDTFEARNSISPTTMRKVAESAMEGKQAALAATATLSSEGNMMVNIHLREPVIPQISADKTLPGMPDFNIRYLPDQPIDMGWIPGELSIEYEMDKLNFDWQTMRGEFQFTPANIELTINEYPRVVIEYVGNPIYVPPSAAPGHEAIDLFV